MSHGHIRIGTFQRLAYERDEDGMRRLVGYALRDLYEEDSDDPVRLLDLVIDRTATLAARYMAAGFVHGVLNSDNINVTGESFDYGPWRFVPTWDPAFVAAYFDHAGLYSFGRQPEAIHWDVMQLAASLRLITESDPMIAVLETFGDRYQRAVCDALLWRLGVQPKGEEDRTLVQAIEKALRTSALPVNRFFFDAFGGNLPQDETWAEARAALSGYASRSSREHAYWRGEPCSMLIDEVEAIWSAIDTRDDWQPFQDKIAAIREMGEAIA